MLLKTDFVVIPRATVMHAAFEQRKMWVLTISRSRLPSTSATEALISTSSAMHVALNSP